MSADLTPFVELVARAKRSMRLAALAPFAPIVGALLVPFPDDVPFTVLRWGFIGLCLMISVGLLLPGLGAPEAHPGIRALKDPDTVCWVFLERARDARTGKQSPPILRVALTSGELRVLPIETGREEELLDLAVAAAPRATRGWSAELEQRFLHQPASLLR